MKKIGILNGEISEIICKMGHTDLLAIGDCGLPIPDETRRIDLALAKDIPTFIDTLKTVLIEFEAEEIILAEEIKAQNPKILEEVYEIFKEVKITFITHEELKLMTKKCKAVIRTGEQTPFANIILKSGVIF